VRALGKGPAGVRQAVFKETASGADNGRPERPKVLALARARRIDAIIVTELSRWAATELAPRDTPIAAATMRQMSRSSTKFRNKP
jgi:DNA invertase Pin-like site-specific DNA recombinase